MRRRTAALLPRAAALLLALAASARAAEPPPVRCVGIEGDVAILLDRGDYLPKPLDDRTPLILRVEAVRPAPGGRHEYDFHYIGFEPGEYRLADYLIRPDGAPAEIGDVRVSVRSVLPPDFNGELKPPDFRPFPWFGGYRMMLRALAALWLLLLAAILWFGRHKRAPVVVETAPPPPTFAERIRPLVESAATGGLGTEGQAELERLLTGYWRERLALAGPRMSETLAALKRHPEAGLLLRALERWLHQPAGASPAEINRLLEPYRRPAAATDAGAGA